MSTIIVHNERPSLLRFGHGKKKIKLTPGTNKVEQELLDEVWQKNKGMRRWWSEAILSFHDAGGAVYVPSTAKPESKRRETAPETLAGIPRLRSKYVVAPDGFAEGDDAKPENPAEAIEPTKMGTGGVPGNLSEAVETIEGVEDLGVLEMWRSNEDRKGALSALNKRIATLSSGAESVRGEDSSDDD